MFQIILPNSERYKLMKINQKSEKRWDNFLGCSSALGVYKKTCHPESNLGSKRLDSESLSRMTKKIAFTLAEVLITLGIIGVVAAMTIPGLITKCRKNVIETQLKETYSMMNQALKLAEYDYEDMDGWDYPVGEGELGGTSAYEWFKKYLQPYLKSSTVSSSYHLYCVWYSGFAIEFINGSGLSCGVNKGGGESMGHFVCMYYPKAGTIKDIRDYSDKARKVVSGRDYFVFEIQLSGPQKGFQPYPSNDCKQTTGMLRLPSIGCTRLIQKNNWEIPSNYPVKI